MSRATIPIAFILTLILITGCNSTSSGTFESGKWQSFSNDKNVERRVDSLLKLMTLEEKIGQMAQFSANWSITGPVMSDDFRPYLEKGLIGSIFNATTVEGIRRFQQFAVDSTRLRIPILFEIGRASCRERV